MIKPFFRNLGYAALGFLVFLNVGTIRKNEDPILKTQTDPISLKQKLEETKDGVKGAPTPSFKYYEKEEFLVKAPTQTPFEEELEKGPAGIADVSEVGFEEDDALLPDEGLEEVEDPAGEDDEDWWVEDDEVEEENLEESGQSTDLQGGHY